MFLPFCLQGLQLDPIVHIPPTPIQLSIIAPPPFLLVYIPPSQIIRGLKKLLNKNPIFKVYLCHRRAEGGATLALVLFPQQGHYMSFFWGGVGEFNILY